MRALLMRSFENPCGTATVLPLPPFLLLNCWYAVYRHDTIAYGLNSVAYNSSARTSNRESIQGNLDLDEAKKPNGDGVEPRREDGKVDYIREGK